MENSRRRRSPLEYGSMTKVELQADDGHVLTGYEVNPQGATSVVVVLQEVFGVNAHIRSVVDRFAGLGYRAIAPAVFDRAEPGIEFDYTAEGAQRGRGLRDRLDWDDAVSDIGAAVDHCVGTGPVSVVGYCYGGSLAWLAAHTLPVAAAVGYYGGQVHQFIDRIPSAPTMLHFGELDPMIPMSDVDEVAAAHPDVIVHVYEGADHGFNCDVRDSYHKASAELALERTLAFLRANGVG